MEIAKDETKATAIGCRGKKRVEKLQVASKKAAETDVETETHSTPDGKTMLSGNLIFSCDFECGNLGSAKPINENEYEITIRPDTNNPRHRLWFYYSVSNAKERQPNYFSHNKFQQD